MAPLTIRQGLICETGTSDYTDSEAITETTRPHLGRIVKTVTALATTVFMTLSPHGPTTINGPESGG